MLTIDDHDGGHDGKHPESWSCWGACWIRSTLKTLTLRTMKRRTLKREPKQVKNSLKMAMIWGGRRRREIGNLGDDKDQSLSLIFWPLPQPSPPPFSKICEVHHLLWSLKNEKDKLRRVYLLDHDFKTKHQRHLWLLSSHYSTDSKTPPCQGPWSKLGWEQWKELSSKQRTPKKVVTILWKRKRIVSGIKIPVCWKKMSMLALSKKAVAIQWKESDWLTVWCKDTDSQ